MCHSNWNVVGVKYNIYFFIYKYTNNKLMIWIFSSTLSMVEVKNFTKHISPTISVQDIYFND